jgi:hypothetical protein
MAGLRKPFAAFDPKPRMRTNSDTYRELSTGASTGIGTFAMRGLTLAVIALSNTSGRIASLSPKTRPSDCRSMSGSSFAAKPFGSAASSGADARTPLATSGQSMFTTLAVATVSLCARAGTGMPKAASPSPIVTIREYQLCMALSCQLSVSCCCQVHMP